jgi:NADH-quinone oxidoreductase subunit L
MVVPLIILGTLSLIGGWIGVPAALGGSDRFTHFLDPVFATYAPAAEVATAAAEAGIGHPAPAEHEDRGEELALMGVSVGVAIIGFFGAWYLYYKRTDLPAKMAASAGGLYRLVLDKYRIDELYGAVIIQPLILLSTNVFWKGIDQTVIDGAVNETAAGAQELSDKMRHMQSGNIRSYAGWVAAGAAAVIAFMVWRGLR